MSTVATTQPWEPLNIPIADPAELEAIVTAAESMTEQAQWQVLHIRAARVQSLAEEARATVPRMTEYEEQAHLSDCRGEMAMTRLAYRAKKVATPARQSRRQLTVYFRHRAHLEAKSNTVEGNV